MKKQQLHKNTLLKEADGALNVLRNRKVSNALFRKATHEVSRHLMRRLHTLLRTRGVRSEEVVIVIILRAAVGMLSAAIETFPDAPVGVLGLGRNERTKRAFRYLEKLPPISKRSTVVILDPMLATGGSAETAVLRLILRGADLKKVYFVGVIGAPEGLSRLAKKIPKNHIMLAALDDCLNEQAMIVPGLGDFGDRYFGDAPPVLSKK
jgi:uracil phosphoribosyltransferase